jgi:hypothetical protein
MNADTLLLSALVERGQSLELRTKSYSPTNLNRLLQDDPFAITVSLDGAIYGERLFRAADSSKVFHEMASAHARTARWRLYTLAPEQESLEFKRLVSPSEFDNLQSDILGGAVFADLSVAALLPESSWLTAHEEEIRTVFTNAIRRAATGVRRFAAARASDDSGSERDALNRIRQEMLDRVGTYTSEDLAAAADSASRNASQFARDLRRAGKVFGVRFGQAWLYPKFQFDSRRHVLPEMKAIVAALTPDPRGWDRLQWFLEPHEALQGRTPLEVWSSNRQRVVEAASMERWNGRD